jgi:hypothetical protein
MNQKVNLIIAVAAGLAGSAIMRYIAPPPAFAQDQTQAPKEIRAQSIALVDQSNRVVGTFTSEAPSAPVRIIPGVSVTAAPSHIVLRDASGRVIWTPDAGTKLLPLTMK